MRLAPQQRLYGIGRQLPDLLGARKDNDFHGQPPF
jgi:hypothetical protein